LWLHSLKVAQLLHSAACLHTNQSRSYLNHLVHKWKPFTGRPAGRPKSRWEDDVRNDLKKMKLMKWTEQVQDRLKWKGIVEKTKTVPEL